MRLRAGIVPAISVLSSFLLAAAAQGAAQLSDGFPLERGTYWIYECRTTRKDFNTLPVQKSSSWKMEILETMRQHDLAIALLRGHLDDLPGVSEPKLPEATSPKEYRCDEGTGSQIEHQTACDSSCGCS